MDVTIILSGPKAAEPQARNTLAAAGYNVLDTSYDHGLPPLKSTKKTKKAQQPVAFLTVHATDADIDQVGDCVAGLRYERRMTHATQPPPPPDPLGEALRDLHQRVAALEGAN